MGRRRKAQGISRAVADTDSESMRGRCRSKAGPVEARRGPRSEGQVVVARAIGSGGGRGVAKGAPVARERVAEGAGAAADGVSERDDGPLLSGPMEVVNEGHVLGHEGTRGDVERVLEQNDGRELWGVDEVGHGRRCRDRR